MIKFASTMGVNFSNFFQSRPIDPNTAAKQIAGLPVKSAKIFSHEGSDLKFMTAAQTNGLTLAVGCTNAELQGLADGKTQSLIGAIKPLADIVSVVCVGNEPLGSWQPPAYKNLLIGACENVRLALASEKLDIGVTVPQNFEFMATSYPPSAGAVNPDLVGVIKSTCGTMSATKAPFMVNIYPFITRIQNRQYVPLPYCLFNAPQSQWVKDGDYTYTNIFDAMLDALHVALGKIGFPNLEIVVGECGWPTGGGEPEATIDNARTFNQALINHCKSSQGTPRHPGKPIQCFVFEMYDEDKKPVDAGQFERHWGCYDGNGGAKYKLTW